MSAESWQSIAIGSRLIGPGQPLFFIAEIGVNHNGDMNLAKRLIDAAVEAGADAAKFQTFTAERLNTRNAPKAGYHIATTGPDAVQSWFDLLKTQELTPAMHRELMDYCRRRGIIFLSTPYDEESADLLEAIDVPAFKVASTDANNLPFLRYLAKKGRPILLSTGMCTMEEVRESLDVLRKEGADRVVLLHCTASYPAPLNETNLRAMVTMARELNVLVGYSDHTLEEVNPVLAVALGAVVYEKHLTEDRSLPGPDHRASLTPADLERTIRLIRQAEQALGSAKKLVQPSETEHRRLLCKSVVAAADLKQGHVLTRQDLAVKRPGTGLPPREMDSFIGRRLSTDVPHDTLLHEGLLEPGAVHEPHRRLIVRESVLRQAVILAGGLGTRFRPVVADRPKPMAEFNSRPFLEHQLDLLKAGGVQDIVLCVGYMAETISAHFRDGSRWGLQIRYSIEPSPLGTGGALKLAEPLLEDTFFLLNGDTFLSCALNELEEHHRDCRADITLTVCRVGDAARYGSVEIGPDERVTGFHEKALIERPGYVNAGLFVMSKSLLASVPTSGRVSLERDLLEGWVKVRRVFAFVLQGGFVDIGTPEGYERFARLAAESRRG